MILSGIADVYAVNRDIGSLYALASYLYEQGQLDRAYRYSTYCSDIGITFKSRVRLLHQQKLQRRIHQSYIERDHMQQKQLKPFFLIPTKSFLPDSAPGLKQKTRPPAHWQKALEWK